VSPVTGLDIVQTQIRVAAADGHGVVERPELPALQGRAIAAQLGRRACRIDRRSRTALKQLAERLYPSYRRFRLELLGTQALINLFLIGGGAALAGAKVAAITRAKAGADAVFFCEDWGTQERLLVSPGMWREIFAPLYERLCAAAKEAGLYVLMHQGTVDRTRAVGVSVAYNASH
jgi:hypothetical protein